MPSWSPATSCSTALVAAALAEGSSSAGRLCPSGDVVRSRRPQRRCPASELVEHPLACLGLKGPRFEAAAGVVGTQADRHLRADRGHSQLGSDGTKVLDGAGSAIETIADERDGLVAPFPVEVIERVLQGRARRMVVLRRDQDERVERLDQLGPRSRGRLLVLATRLVPARRATAGRNRRGRSAAGPGMGSGQRIPTRRRSWTDGPDGCCPR